MLDVARPVLRLLDPTAIPSARPLASSIPAGRLIELSGSSQHGIPTARTSVAVSLVRHAQLEGETTAWLQPEGGQLYPPDLRDSGIDLDALVVIQVPRGQEGPSPTAPQRARIGTGHRLCKAAELLLRSGAFGLLVIDLSEGAPSGGAEAWQSRLLGLARQYESRIVLLTDKPAQADSLGTLVGLRIEPRREREAPGRFRIFHEILKNKSGAPFEVAPDRHRGPWGLN